jgi:hypothetical protein
MCGCNPFMAYVLGFLTFPAICLLIFLKYLLWD